MSPMTSPPIPPPGSVLRQFNSTTRLAGDGESIIGYFNPRRVTHRLRRLMMDDPLIAFGTAIHMGAITNLAYSVESRDPEVGAFVEAALERIYDNLALAIAMAIPFGWQVVEKVWAVESLLVEVEKREKGVISADDKTFPTAWIIERTKAIPHETINLLIDEERDAWGGVEQFQNGRMSADGKGKVGPEHVILWSHRAEQVGGKLTGRALLDQVYEPWWFGVAHELHTNRYFERKADPSIIGRHPEGVTGPDGQAIDGGAWILDQAATLRNGGVVALSCKRDEKSGEYLTDLQYLQDDKRGDMFDARMEKLEIRKLRGLLITDRVMAAGAGGIGTGDSEFQADVLAQFLEGNVRHFLGAVLNPQVVDPIVLYNFGEERWRQSRTRVVAGGLSSSMRTMLQDVLKAVLAADSVNDGTRPSMLMERLDVEGIARSLKLPMRPFEESQQIEEERRKVTQAALGMPDPTLDPAGAAAAKAAFQERGVKDLPGSDEAAPPADLLPVTKVVDAQVAKAVNEVVRQVTAGELPRDSGIGMLISQFGLSPEDAEATMGSAGTEAPVTPNPNPKAEAEAKAKADQAEAVLKAKQQGQQQLALELAASEAKRLAAPPTPPPAPPINVTVPITIEKGAIQGGDVQLDATLELKPGDRKIVLRKDGQGGIEGESKAVPGA